MSHHPDNEPTALYRLYDADDRLLYLGISWNPDARMQDHMNHKHWTHLVVRRTVEWYPDRPTALSAEADATAAEKPLHDSSWRKSQVGEKPEWRDPEGRQRVQDGLTAEIEQGKHWLGEVLKSGVVAKRFNVSRPTASDALKALQKRGLLKFRHHGRFEVLKGPSREEFENQFGEVREEKNLHGAYLIWTVAELREAIKDLPEGTLISARLSNRLPRFPG